MTIIGVLGIKDQGTEGKLIIIFALLQWTFQCIKLCWECKDGKADIDGLDADDFESGEIGAMMRQGSAIKMMAVGGVDAVFDVIVGIAYINNIEEVINNENKASIAFLIQLGTLIGFGEQVLELLQTILLALVGAVFNVGVLGLIEILTAWAEIGIMIYVCGMVTDDNVFLGLSLTALILLSCLLCLPCGQFVILSFYGCVVGKSNW